MSLGWTAVQLRAMQARAQEAGKPSRSFNPKPLGSVQPGSKTALALRVLREQAGNDTGGWVVYGDLLALMGKSDGRSIHWALNLLTRRGHIEVRVHHGRRFSYRITPEGLTSTSAPTQSATSARSASAAHASCANVMEE